MATFRLQILSERLFSKGGKLRKDKRKAYAIKQQQQQKPKQKIQVPAAPKQKAPATTTPAPIVNQKPQVQQPQQAQQNNPVIATGNGGVTNVPAPIVPPVQQQQQTQAPSQQQPQAQQGSSSQQKPQSNEGQQQSTSGNGNQGKQQKQQPNIDPENVVIGQQPTGQQGTTGSVDWGQLGSAAFGKVKPIVRGAALTAGVLGAGALAAGLYGTKKVGEAVGQGLENIDERQEENRRWRREEKMAKRLIKAGYNPYQEGQRIGGYSFTKPYYR